MKIISILYITPKKHLNKQRPLFILHEIPKHLQIKFLHTKEQISEKLEILNITNSCIHFQVIDELEQQFNENDPNKTTLIIALKIGVEIIIEIVIIKK